MSPNLLSVLLLLFIVATHSVPVPPSSRPVSVQRAVARRRHAHHIAFVVRAAQLAVHERVEESAVDLGSVADEGGKQMDADKTDSSLGTNAPAPAPAPAQEELQQIEPKASEPQQNETKQSEPKTIEPQQSAPQQSNPQQNETSPKQQNDSNSQQQAPSGGTSQPHQPPQAQQTEQETSLSKSSIQPPFSPSVSTVGLVGAIATVIIAAFLVWSKSSNNTLSPVRIAGHAYERVRPEIQDANVSAQSSADADGWNAGWDDDDDWNPEAPGAKV